MRVEKFTISKVMNYGMHGYGSVLKMEPNAFMRVEILEELMIGKYEALLINVNFMHNYTIVKPRNDMAWDEAMVGDVFIVRKKSIKNNNASLIILKKIDSNFVLRGDDGAFNNENFIVASRIGRAVINNNSLELIVTRDTIYWSEYMQSKERFEDQKITLGLLDAIDNAESRRMIRNETKKIINIRATK